MERLRFPMGMSPSLFLLGCIVVLTLSISAEDKLLRELLDESVYDQATRPRDVNGGDGPCLVEIDLLLNSVGPVSSLKMELTTSFYLRQEWVDPRLRFTNTSLRGNTFGVGPKYLEKLWVPDLYFTMGTDTFRHDMTTLNTLIRLSSDGTVFFSQRITSTVKCLMDLSKFPHDTQQCRNSMMSYSYTTDDLIFRWSSKRKATTILANAFLAEFTLSDTRVADCTETFVTGTFTCLEAILVLEREIGYYLTQTYIPSVLIVMLSWAAFWIDHEAVPARISVGLLTVLTITTQSTGARAELPRVSYVKAIDVWMSMNLVFVFAAYMEYAVVTVMSRRYKKMLRKKDEATEKDRSESVSTDTNLSEIIPASTSPATIDTNSVTPTDPSTNHNDDNVSNNLFTNSNGDTTTNPYILPYTTTFSLRRSASSYNVSSLPKDQPSGRETSNESTKRSSSKNGWRFNQILKRRKSMLIFKRNFGRRVDFHSRYLFPFVYVLFNLGYWCGYLMAGETSD